MEWGNFLIVLVASVVAACGVVALFSVGIRLVSASGPWLRATGIASFVACGALVLYGVYLIVPTLHR
ncbi:hypothetical protein FVP33_07940 [Lacisediminihabitans profunda]|uniref:Uncharacterized protein n=1 Tax=Lacisediminihabitans profunda TaxID=2594790 RepID=A0A5C8UTS3_9MICO|nr:hypothetical protein FVP33_07940 [Lacisediminihabitans profunda]